MAQSPLTVTEFRARFSAFRDTDAALVQVKLDEAWRRTPADVWGDQAQDAQAYLAADLIALDPMGGAARMVQKDGSTTFGRTRDRMEAELGPAVAPRVT